MPPRLIVNADDFGLTPGIDRAIIELHQAGVLTSTSLMATGPTFPQAVALAREHPRLGIGCHLVFVDGTPISHPHTVPTLLGGDDKTFRTSIAEFVVDLVRGRIRADELAREAQAQIQLLQRSGVDVTHIDTHKHLHVFPAVLDTLLFVARRCGIDSLRCPWEPVWSAAEAKPELSRRLQLAALERAGYRRHFLQVTGQQRSAGLLPDGTLGIAATGLLDATTLRAMLGRLAREPDGTTCELCCHPGHVDAALGTLRTRLHHSRAVEYQALLDVIPEFSQNSQAEPTLALIHYGNLGVPGLKRAAGQHSPATGYEKVL
jgi:predicted glycoside hydrolase/deacetylase ChbG (UPF0249 family)